MKKILFILLTTYCLLPTDLFAQLELPYPVKNLNPKPLDYYYYNTSGTPYTTTAQVIAQVPPAVRYRGMTFNVTGVEYWFGAGIADGDLVASDQFGTYTFSNGLTKTSTSVKLGGTLIQDVDLIGGIGNHTIRMGSAANPLRGVGMFSSNQGGIGGDGFHESYNFGLSGYAYTDLGDVGWRAITPTGNFSTTSGIEIDNNTANGVRILDAFIGSNTYLNIKQDRVNIFSTLAGLRMAIGGNGVTDNPASILDLQSTTKGFSPPRMTTTDRNAIASPFAGLSLYNTTRNEQNFYTGAAYRATAYAPEVNTQAGTTYTIVAADLGKKIFLTSATPVTVTLPNGLMNDFKVEIVRKGAGIVTLVATGTLEGTGSTIELDETGVEAYHASGNVWTVTGSLGAPIVADVVGPASAVNNNVVFFDGVSGKLIKDSGLTLSGSNTGNVTLAGENYLSLAGQVITANAVNLSNTNVTGTLAAARFPALTGDVTNTVGTLATTIANDAVTYAKIQNVTDNRLLGRSAGTNGDAQEITIGAGLSLSGGTLSNPGSASSWSLLNGGTQTGANVFTATGTNNITFNYATLGGANGFTINSPATDATGNTQKLFNVTKTGLNANANQTNYAAYISNLTTGGTAKTVGLYADATASGTLDSYGAVFSPQIGIGDVVGGTGNTVKISTLAMTMNNGGYNFTSNGNINFAYDQGGITFTGNAAASNDNNVEIVNNQTSGVLGGINYANLTLRGTTNLTGTNVSDVTGLIINQTITNIVGKYYGIGSTAFLHGFGTLAPTATVHARGVGTTTGELLRLNDLSGTNRLLMLDNGTLSGSFNVPVANGGTGAATLTGIPVGAGTAALTAVAGTASQVLRRNPANTAYEFFTLGAGTGDVVGPAVSVNDQMVKFDGITGKLIKADMSTGIVKTTVGVTSVALNSDLPVMSATVGGAVPTPPNNTTTFLRGDATFSAIVAPAGTLTGATLAAGVTASSLTSVGTLTALTMGGAIVTAAGTTAVVPINIPSSVQQTTPASGDITRNASGVFTATPATGETGNISSKQGATVIADFTLVAAAGVQSAFPTTDDVWTLTASTAYDVEGHYIMTTGTTSKTTAIAFALGGGASVTFIALDVLGSNNVPNATTTAQGTLAMTQVASTVVTAAATVAGVSIKFKGKLYMNAGGTVTPQINFSANPTGTNLMKIGSYITFTRIGTNTFARIGNVN